MLERAMSARQIEADDHEAMRELLDELIRMQAVANAARSEGLADDPDVRAELRLAEIQTLYRHYVNEAQRAAPVTDEAIREVYDQQVERSGGTQYRIRTVKFNDQARAIQAIERLRSGAIDFEQLEGEAESAGLTVARPGWIDRSQVPESFAPSLAETSAGDVVGQPLQNSQGWYVVRVDETRDLQVPDFEEVREGIARSLLQRRREALVDSLYDQAEITPMLPLDDAKPAADSGP
jgi:peptidyl-prolyl cis-trans isomerase C